jgi:hypothetical protein
MAIGKTALGLIAALCVTAGLGGFYFATRGAGPAALKATGVEVTQTEETIALPDADAIVAEVPAGVSAPVAPAPPPRAERRPAPPRRTPASEPQVATARPQPAPAVVDTRMPPAAAERPEAPPSVSPVTEREPELPSAAEPAPPEFVELTVPTDAVVGLQVETSLTSETARVEDEVVARVTRDVRVGDRVAIPAGARAHGEVTLVERGGRLKERARLGVRFTSVVLADGTRVPLETETVYREGDAPSGESAAKIGGGAIGGAILGGIFGGARGAAIGGSIGAGAGTAAVLAGGRNPATLTTGTPVTVRVVTPTTVTVEK